MLPIGGSSSALIRVPHLTTRDRGRVLVRMDRNDFLVAVRRRCRRMDVQGAEEPAERLVLFQGHS